MAFVRSSARGVAAFMLLLGLSSCYDTDPMPLSDIGPARTDGARLIGRVGDRNARNVGYQTPDQEPVQSTSRQYDTLQPADVSPGSGGEPGVVGTQAQTQNPPFIEASAPVAASLDQSPAPANPGEVDMDSQFGFKTDKTAPNSTPQIAEGNVDQPVVDGIGTNELKVVSPSDQTARISDSLPASAPQPAPQQVAMVPRMDAPTAEPRRQPGVLPDNERFCRQQLQRYGVSYRDIPGIHDSAQCGIDYPVEVTAINGVRILPAAKLNCAMALTFARWTRDDLVPSTRVRYFSGVKAIRQMSSYSCRRMNSQANNPWSEHAHGNAIDIGTIVLNNGDEVDVRKPGFFSFRQKGLLNSVRADSCRYFNTVLGPGDPYHGNHFHFDLRSRKSGRRYCSLR